MEDPLRGSHTIVSFESQKCQNVLHQVSFDVCLKSLVPHDDAQSMLHSHYISPINLWIEEKCNDTNQVWHHFFMYTFDHNLMLKLGKTIFQGSSYDCFVLNVSLFWSCTKHKGRIVNIFIKWLHYISLISPIISFLLLV